MNNIAWALREKALANLERFQTSTDPNLQLARQKIDREFRAEVGDFIADLFEAKRDGDQPLPDEAVVH